MLDEGAGLAVDLILSLLLRTQSFLTASTAVRNEQAGALIAAISDHRNASADDADTRLGEDPAVVAAAGQRIADCPDQVAVGVNDHLVRRVPVILAEGGDAPVGGDQGAVDDGDGVLALAAGQ